MTRLAFSNFGEATLLAALGTSGTSFAISTDLVSKFPSTATGKAFLVTLYDGVQAPELALCTALDAGTGTLIVTRGQESTPTNAWGAGTRVRLAISADVMSAVQASMENNKARAANIFDYIPPNQHNAILANTSTYDVSTDFQTMIDEAATAKTRCEINGGTYRIGTQLTLPDRFYLDGISRRQTTLQNVGANNLFDLDGSYLGVGGHLKNHVVMKNLNINLQSTGLKALKAKGTSLLLLEDINIGGGAAEQLHLDEVFDSWINRVNFKNGSASAHTTLITFGSGDNTNQVRFNDCTWETNRKGSVKIVSGVTTTETVNGMRFSKCKWENGGSDATSSPIEISDSGAGTAHIVLDGPVISHTNDYQPFMKIVGKIENLVIRDGQIQDGSSQTVFQPVIDVSACTIIKNICYENNTGYGVVNANYYAIKLAGATGVVCVSGRNNFFNGARSFLCDVDTGIGNVLLGLVEMRSHGRGPDFKQYYYDAAGTLLGQAIMSVDAFGNTILYNNGFLGLKINRADGLVTFPAAGMQVGSAWNTGQPLRMGAFYLWVDGTGDLRIKSGAPTSDTDGTVVGTQT